MPWRESQRFAELVLPAVVWFRLLWGIFFNNVVHLTAAAGVEGVGVRAQPVLCGFLIVN